MSDPNEPTGPEGSADEPAPAPPPPSQPPPPSSDLPPPPTPGDTYGGAATGGGGYGAPPANPYGQPPAAGGTAAYSATDAIAYGWRKFTASPGTLLIPMIVVFVGILVVSVLVQLVIGATLLDTHSCTQTVLGQQIEAECGPSFSAQLLGAGLASALIILVAQLLAAGLYKGATHVTDGKPFGLGQMFDGWDKSQVVIASLIIAAATFVGTLLCYIPGLIVGFLTQYTLLFIVDKQMSAIDAIKASVKFVVDNLGNTLLYYILAALVLIVGAIVCLVGLLVAAPVALIGLAYTYRRLQDEPVVP
jgi:uncharacterized membrane protein